MSVSSNSEEQLGTWAATAASLREALRVDRHAIVGFRTEDVGGEGFWKRF